VLRIVAPLFNRISVRWQRRVLALGVPKFFVGVAAVCVDGERVLLARHRMGDPRWRLPGGFLQRNETVEQCARRELREELGCDVEVLGLLDVTAGYRYPRVEIALRCRLATPIGDLSSEVIEARYFALAELPPIRIDQRELIERALTGSSRTVTAGG
jgi:ADP-ribose pyrophosphatase YjhB (NUDIX family)